MSVYVRNGKFYVDYYDENRLRVRRMLDCTDRETAENIQTELATQGRKMRFVGPICLTSQIAQYPSIPPPTIRGSNAKASLPVTSGVYFFWDDWRVLYVGSAVNLRRRIGTGHKKWSQDYWLSYIEMDKTIAAGAEAYYIGKLRPPLNSESKPLLDGRTYKKYRPRLKP